MSDRVSDAFKKAGVFDVIKELNIKLQNGNECFWQATNDKVAYQRIVE